MVAWLLEPWPWWLSGILIGLTVPLLYVLAGKAFGISTSLQEIGAVCTPHCRWPYLSQFDRKANAWTLVFVVGIGVGAWIANRWLSAAPVDFLPAAMETTTGGIKLLVGGFLIGFGTRYAGGCTSGHSITGIANLNGPSLVATICFFVGGLSVTRGFGALVVLMIKMYVNVLLVGMYLGILFTKSEVARWHGVHDMFLFREPHMYLIIGTAIVVAMLSMWLLKRFGVRSISGQPIRYTPKPYHRGVLIGGVLFGAGWAITGACPGPIYAQIGGGEWFALLTFVGAVLGMYSYAALKSKLPH